MDSLTDWLNASLKNADHELFKDVVKVEADIEPMGDGQVIIISDIKRVTLSLETSSGEKKELKVIAKIEPPEGPGKYMAEDTGAFSTEIMMYSDLLKSMESVMAEVDDNTIFWPECYLSKDNKFILQDLCEVGYRIVPTYKFLDVDHAVLVMEGLGKFHGLSLVLKERGLLDTSRFDLPFFAKENPGMENIQKKFLEDTIEAVNSWGPEWSSVSERIKEYFARPTEKMRELWKMSKGKWDVLNHGDFTMRNMLFHYKPNSLKPDGIRFVDFQMCNYSNLAFDIALLLYSSLMPSVRDENMKTFLTCYTNSLVSTCKRHGYAGSLPTYEDVHATLKSFHTLNNAVSIFQVPYFMQSNRGDIQKRTDECVEGYTSDSSKPVSGSFIDYSDDDIKGVLQSELRRCINEKLF